MGKKYQILAFAKYVPTSMLAPSTLKVIQKMSFVKTTYAEKVKTFLITAFINSNTKTTPKVKVYRTNENTNMPTKNVNIPPS